MKILGVDPSLRSTGYGVVETHGSQMKAIVCGEIKNPSDLSHSQCLLRIGDSIGRLLTEHRPDAMAVEGLVYVQNTRIAFTLGQVRGVILAEAARHGVPAFEYAPRRVKQTVTGRGSAGKQQVACMVKAQLNLAEVPSSDVADALALAICHAQSLRGVQLRPLRPL
ncbi:MAG: crossover junction endodeoxyribonuclease RuvC [Verrucomicrobiae bacterium]|nr:crossover junction endodeoxyribonuclease RuvC [Verrucomicrobiae bacterium]